MPPKKCIKKRSRRRLGARSYKNYSEEMLLLAVDFVRNKKTTSYDAEKQFGIPRRTIEKRVKNLHSDKPGPRFRLSPEEENKFVKVLIAAGDYGCPLSQLDLKLAVYDYLKTNNKTYVFNDKLPGDWWVKYFLERHKDQLTLRSTQNITKARAKKSLEEFKEYFENLEISLQNIPPTNIMNYDETNVSDDPGSTKCIFRRGIKYPERILNHSKGCISIMFAATADGELLPPYVVFKSDNLWTAWCTDGPEGTRYNRSKSGWFDSVVFLDWFMNIVIPWANHLEGQKLVIGDNLSSHLNPDIIELCEAHQIRFVFLPSRSTHLTQPLDVAFFGPLKKSWRKILLQYKTENPKQASLNKTHFPLLLKQLMEAANMKKQNVLSGFRATGIHPYNPYEVYKKLPEYEDDIKYDVDQTLLNYLKENKHPNPIKTRKNTKIKVLPGKSVSSTEISFLSINKTTNTKTKTVTKKNTTSNINISKTATDYQQKEEAFVSEKKAKAKNFNNTLPKKAFKRKPLKRKKPDDSSDSESNCSVTLCDSSEYDPKDDEDSEACTMNEIIIGGMEDPDMERKNEDMIESKESKEFVESKVMEETNRDTLVGINHKNVKEASVEVTGGIESKTISGLGVEEGKTVRIDHWNVPENQDIKEQNKEIMVYTDLKEVSERPNVKGKNMEMINSTHYKKYFESQSMTETKQPGRNKEKEVKLLSDIRNTPENKKYFDLQKYGPFKLEAINKDTELVLGKKGRGKCLVKAKSTCTNKKIHIPNVKEIPSQKNESASSIENYSMTALHLSPNMTANDNVAGCSKEPERNLISYNVNDYVLARYLYKKKIKYFVGKIISKIGNKYEVSFYKQYGRSDNTKFTQPHRKDIDTIDEEMIVKEVQLMALNEQETEFVFLEDDDLVYFDY